MFLALFPQISRRCLLIILSFQNIEIQPSRRKNLEGLFLWQLQHNGSALVCGSNYLSSILSSYPRTECRITWLFRLVWVQETPGSNPGIPTSFGQKVLFGMHRSLKNFRNTFESYSSHQKPPGYRTIRQQTANLYKWV